jgi:hypothetical protein
MHSTRCLLATKDRHSMNPNRIGQALKRCAHSRLALSTVVTTLIVLVVSVLLAGVVTYFAINVTSTRVQEESLVLAKQHIWFDAASGTTQAAIMVINTGGRDVVVDRLTVRGQECAWSKVYFTTVGDSVSGDLFYNTTLIDGGTISVGGSNRVFEQASNDLTIQSGKTLIMYIHNPDSISVNDIGLTVSINIFTSQAMYYKETNVQGTSGTTISSDTPSDDDSTLKISSVEAYYSSGSVRSLVLLIVDNVGSSSIVITKDDLIIKGEQVTATTLDVQVNSEGSPVTMDSITIQSGDQVLLLFYNDGTTYINSSDIESPPISVGLNLGGGQSVTIQVQVVAG